MSDQARAPSCREFVAGLAEAGVTKAFISPGSRNTPMTLALAACDAIEDISIRDERSAGFMALGFAKATGVPAVVVCTSGSAATHYYPAVVEADQAAFPLIAITADRPVALRGTFAPQTMDQESLYGGHVKASVEIDFAETDTRAAGVAAARTACDGIPGPVHINAPFDEPLTPASYEPESRVDTVTGTAAAPEIVSIDHLVTGRRVLIVTGGFLGVDFPELLGRYADALGAPVLADPQSRPEAESTIAAADLLATAGELDKNPPDVVISFGGLPTSKPIWQWLESSGVPQILVNRSRLTDPLGSATELIELHPRSVVARFPEVSADRGYLAAWQQVDAVALEAIDGALSDEGLSEPLIARATVEHAPSGSIVFVGSSMPIRDVASYARARADVSIVSNRGVNGIDGTISTALGCATSGHPTTVLLGDVAALHDVSAIAEVESSGVDLRIVVINNDGGGIFSFLPQKQSGVVPESVYEKHWGTPHGMDIAPIAAAMGMRVHTVDTVEDLRAALSQPVRRELVEIHTDRATNVDHHRTIQRAVNDSLAGVVRT